MKFLYLFTFGILINTYVHSDVIIGKISNVQNNIITLKTDDGSKISFLVKDETSYRKKKVLPSAGRRSTGSDVKFQPLVKKGNFIEINYQPTGNEKPGSVFNAGQVSEVILLER